jgi:phosphoribosylformylglycinamidine synthase
LIGAEIDLSALKAPEGQPPLRLDALLFGETQSRVVVTCTSMDALKVVERAKLMGVPAMQIGSVGGTNLAFKTSESEFSAPVGELHDAWWNAIARAMG